jgi:hypothetical protein
VDRSASLCVCVGLHCSATLRVCPRPDTLHYLPYGVGRPGFVRERERERERERATQCRVVCLQQWRMNDVCSDDTIVVGAVRCQ